MRILLVKPHSELLVARRLQEGFLRLEPLDLEIVAGGIPEKDDVTILDLNLEQNPFDAFQEYLRRWLPDIVGFTGYTSNAFTVKRLAGMVKAYNPAVITVVGGIHATIAPHDYAIDDIDIIVRGEGGTTFREILNRLKKKVPLFFDNRALSPNDPEFNRKIALLPPAYPPVEEIPLPRRDLVQKHRYFCVWTSSSTKKLDTMFPQVASLRTSIGCPFSCSFCVVPHVMGGKYLQRNPEDVVDEIESLQENYIYFVDDEMFLNASRVTYIAELLLERRIKKKYISWARSDTIVKHPELFRLWKQVGLDTVYVGLESMDKSRLNDYQKRTNVEINRKAVAFLREIGITLHAAFIVHPNFTVEDFRHLQKEIKNICPAECTFTVFSPSPGTKLEHQHKEGFICDPYRFYDCMHTLLPTNLPLRQFYRYFSDLYITALRANPLRLNKIRVPYRDIIRALVTGTRFVVSLRKMYQDYPPENNL